MGSDSVQAWSAINFTISGTETSLGFSLLIGPPNSVLEIRMMPWIKSWT